MAGDQSPTLDRYVQQDLGRAIRERIYASPGGELPSDMERLLETLKAREEYQRNRRPTSAMTS